MALSLRFHVVQYIEDPYLAEGRNIAILAHHNGRGYYKALGVDGYNMTPSHFKSLSPKARDSYWAYREWVEWFRSLANVREAEQFEKAVTRLEANNSGMLVANEGVLELISGNEDELDDHIFDRRLPDMLFAREAVPKFPNRYYDISDAMNYLFKRLVRVPKISPALAFEDRLEKVLNKTEIIYAGNFWGEPVEVEMFSENEQEIVTLEFSLLIAGDRPIGFNTLVLQGASQKSVARQVELFAKTFKNAIRTGYLQPDRCVLLCGKVEEKHREVLAQLSGIAEVMDIFDGLTPRNIRKLVFPNS